MLEVGTLFFEKSISCALSITFHTMMRTHYIVYNKTLTSCMFIIGLYTLNALGTMPVVDTYVVFMKASNVGELLGWRIC